MKNFVETQDGMDWPIGYGAGLTLQDDGHRRHPDVHALRPHRATCVWGGHSLDGLEDAAVAALAEK